MYQTTLIQHIIVSFDRSPLWEMQSSPKRNCLSICLCGVCLHVYQHCFFFSMPNQVTWTTIGAENSIVVGKVCGMLNLRNEKMLVEKGGNIDQTCLNTLIY